MNDDLMTAVISLGSQILSVKGFLQTAAFALGLIVFFSCLMKLIRSSNNQHQASSPGMTILTMFIASLVSALSAWGQIGFSAYSSDQFGNTTSASTVLNYYGVSGAASAKGAAVLQAVFNIVEAYGWFAILSAGYCFIRASSQSSGSFHSDPSLVWKGFMRWLGGTMCISIGWTLLQIYNTLHSSI